MIPSTPFRILLLSLALLGCASPEGFRRHSDFTVGMSREEVLERFGPPEDTQVLVKTSPFIWGPIEGFWDQIPQGSRVETWSYRSKARFAGPSSELTDGSTQLYFVDGSDTVDGIGFAVEGAVY